MSTAKKTKKQAEPAPATNGTHVEDISHEVVTDNSNETESEKAEVIDPQKQIKSEIAKFQLADAGIAQLKKEYGALVIAGPDDKAGYKQVREAWSLVRSKRTGLEKKGLEIRNRFKIITSAVSKEEDRLVELLTPLEEELHKKWKDIDDEKDRLKREAEEEEKRQLMARVEEVLALGMTFKDGFYVCGDTISMDVATLRALPLEQYDKLKKAVEAKAAEIAKAEAEADAAAEKQREADRLQKEKDELKRQQDELRQQQEDLQRQQDQLKKDQEAAVRLKKEIRINKLSGLGMWYNEREDTFIFDNSFRIVTHNGKALFDLDDYGFDEHTKVITGLIKESQDDKATHELEKKKEAEALELKKKAIGEKMTEAGFNFSYTAQAFTWENDIKAMSTPLLELIPMTEEELSDKIKALKHEKYHAETLSRDHKIEREAAAEKERKAGLTDKKRWDEQITQVENAILQIIPGEYKTAKHQKLAQSFLESITTILKGVK